MTVAQGCEEVSAIVAPPESGPPVATLTISCTAHLTLCDAVQRGVILSTLYHNRLWPLTPLDTP